MTMAVPPSIETINAYLAELGNNTIDAIGPLIPEHHFYEEMDMWIINVVGSTRPHAFSDLFPGVDTTGYNAFICVDRADSYIWGLFGPDEDTLPDSLDTTFDPNLGVDFCPLSKILDTDQN